MRLRRAKRVRIHYNHHEPSLEGLLVSRGRLSGEYVVAVPQLLVNAESPPVAFDEARYMRIPHASVWQYEEL